MSPHRRRIALSILLALAVALSWSGVFDQHAMGETRAAFKHALVAFATARALNGAISVIQGTELALQPAGLGVTLTAGQILDPLNDLVERFSWVMLLCAVSLGAQIVVQEAAMSPWSNVVLSAAAALAVLWFFIAHYSRAPSTHAGERFLVGLVALMIFLRFIVAGAAEVSHAVGDQFLSERRDAAVDYLASTRSELEALDESDDSASWLDDITAQLKWVDIEARLSELADVIERSVEEIINLIVVFTLQAILLPLAVLLGGAAILRRLQIWR
ncbi:MAG: hypothetical protein P8Y95_06035 [Gammaproteobacteria bacterium]